VLFKLVPGEFGAFSLSLGGLIFYELGSGATGA